MSGTGASARTQSVWASAVWLPRSGAFPSSLVTSAAGASRLLVVDQAEELFTACDAAVAARFARLLVRGLGRPSPGGGDATLGIPRPAAHPGLRRRVGVRAGQRDRARPVRPVGGPGGQPPGAADHRPAPVVRLGGQLAGLVA